MRQSGWMRIEHYCFSSIAMSLVDGHVAGRWPSRVINAFLGAAVQLYIAPAFNSTDVRNLHVPYHESRVHDSSCILAST